MSNTKLAPFANVEQWYYHDYPHKLSTSIGDGVVEKTASNSMRAYRFDCPIIGNNIEYAPSVQMVDAYEVSYCVQLDCSDVHNKTKIWDSESSLAELFGSDVVVYPMDNITIFSGNTDTENYYYANLRITYKSLITGENSSSSNFGDAYQYNTTNVSMDESLCCDPMEDVEIAISSMSYEGSPVTSMMYITGKLLIIKNNANT